MRYRSKGGEWERKGIPSASLATKSTLDISSEALMRDMVWCLARWIYGRKDVVIHRTLTLLIQSR
jgi:hypothetical protein